MEIILFASTFVVYLYCMSNGTYGGDSGDLLSAVYTNGVAHPSGYPLYLIIGKSVTAVLPEYKNFAWNLGVVSAIFSSAAVVYYYKTIKLLLSLFRDKLQYIHKVILAISAFTLAFLYPFWLYSVTVEVFSLHIFLLSLITYFLVKAGETRQIKYFYLLSYICGISLTNNQTILLVFPPLALALIFIYKKGLLIVKNIALGFALFIFGLLPYLYLPYLARQNPTVNWGFAVNFDNFIALSTRKEYGWNSFEKGINIDGVLNTLKGTRDYWLVYIGLGVILPALIGIFNIPKAIRGWLLPFVVLAFLLFGPFFLVYANTPPKNFLTFAIFEKFYLSPLYIVMLLYPFGILLIQKKISQFFSKLGLSKYFNFLVILIFLISLTGQFANNLPKLNLNKVSIGDDFAKDILNSLPQNSTLLLMSDTHAFNAIYLQQVLNYRKDISIPGLYDGFDIMLKTAGIEEEKVREHKVKNRGSIDNATMGIAISELAVKGQLYSDQKLEITDNKYGKITSVPWGLVYKVVAENEWKMSEDEYLKVTNNIFSGFHLKEIAENENVLTQSLTFADAQKIYSIAHERTAYYIKEKYGLEDEAIVYLKKAIELDPIINH